MMTKRENLEIDIHESIKSEWQWFPMLALAANSMMDKPISFDTQWATWLIWSFIFSSGFHALIVSRTPLNATIRAENETSDAFCFSESTYGWVGWERDVCTWVGLGRWAWWWKFHHWTLCVQNTFLILIMVEKPTSRPMEFCHICRKGKLYTPWAILQKWREKGVFFFNSLFSFEIWKGKLPTAGKFNFHACFLGWTLCPLRYLTGFYDLFCQRRVPKSMSFGSHKSLLSPQWTC